MNLERLEYFAAIARAGSFSNAAESLFTTQSTVSKQILALEKNIGIELFDRSSRRIVITPAGRSLLPHVQEILDSYTGFKTALNTLKESVVKVAIVPVIRQFGLMDSIDQFQKSHPNIRMFFEEREMGDYLPDFERGHYEMVFGAKEIFDADKYETIDLEQDRAVAVLPASHALAKEASVRLHVLRDERFFFLSKNTGFYNKCIEACEASGFTPNVGYVGSHPDTIASVVEKESCVALLMNKVAQSIAGTQIVIVPLEEKITATMSLVRAKNKSHTGPAKTFWNYFRGNTRYPINSDGQPF